MMMNSVFIRSEFMSLKTRVNAFFFEYTFDPVEYFSSFIPKIMIKYKEYYGVDERISINYPIAHFIS